MENTFKQRPIIDIETKVMGIYAEAEFAQLTDAEKRYSYHLAEVSWEGSKICYFQKSWESPAIFHLFQHVFNQPLNTLKESLLKAGGSEEVWTKFCLYAATFFQNAGNYKGFGDTKFVPDLDEETFFKVLEVSEAFRNEDLKPRLLKLWHRIKFFIFNFEKPFDILGVVPEGVTGYYSNDISKDDILLVNEFLAVINLSYLNTRIGKIKDGEFIVTVASANFKDRQTHFYKNVKVHVVYGDFAPILRRLSYHLEKAYNFAANKTQKKMIDNYIKHFNTGDIEIHKDSQRDWVKDVGPVVESNFGFIETYADPVGVRAEYEGWVAMVNKKQSLQTAAVVERADTFLSQSPWPKEFEKDKFLKPDFTSLAVIAFGCSGTPLGINIPNYDDIRQEEGFKNVYLGNCVAKPKSINYINPELAANLIENYEACLFHKVIFHELLGHGCGKLFQEDSQGKKNFDPNTINPLTNKPVESWYKANETWSSVFGKWNNPYEECRADSVALYFSCFPQATEVLQPEMKDKWEKIMEGNFTEFVIQGINSLEFYNTETGKFSQAHVNGRFVILQVLLEAGNGFIKIEKTKNEAGKDWISIDIDRSQCLTTGLNAMKNFLLRLNVYKALADKENGIKMFENYSKPSPFFLELREIVLANKKPRRLEVQGNILVEGDRVVYRTYPESFEGIIDSFKQRFSYVDNEVYALWEEGNEYFHPHTPKY